MKLIGDQLIVKKVEIKEIKRASGLIISMEAKPQQLNIGNAVTLVRVLYVGEGYYDEETGETVPLDYKVGNILKVPGTATEWISMLPIPGYAHFSAGFVSANSVQACWESEEELNKFFEGAQHAFE